MGERKIVRFYLRVWVGVCLGSDGERSYLGVSLRGCVVWI